MVLVFGKSSSSFFISFLQKQEVLSVGFKSSLGSKKKKNFALFSLVIKTESSFDSAEREREVTDSLLLVLVSVFLRLFL